MKQSTSRGYSVQLNLEKHEKSAKPAFEISYERPATHVRPGFQSASEAGAGRSEGYLTRCHSDMLC